MPKSLPTMRVCAVEGRLLPAIDASGMPLVGRYVARTRKGAPIPEGVLVPQDSHHLRAVRNGDLERVADGWSPPAAPSTEPPAVEATSDALPEAPVVEAPAPGDPATETTGAPAAPVQE